MHNICRDYPQEQLEKFIIEAEKGGNTRSARRLIEWFHFFLTNDEIMPTFFFEYMMERFKNIADGASADKELHLNNRRGGQPLPHLEHMYQVLIAISQECESNGYKIDKALKTLSKKCCDDPTFKLGSTQLPGEKPKLIRYENYEALRDLYYLGIKKDGEGYCKHMNWVAPKTYAKLKKIPNYMEYIERNSKH